MKTKFFGFLLSALCVTSVHAITVVEQDEKIAFVSLDKDDSKSLDANLKSFFSSDNAVVLFCTTPKGKNFPMDPTCHASVSLESTNSTLIDKKENLLRASLSNHDSLNLYNSLQFPVSMNHFGSEKSFASSDGKFGLHCQKKNNSNTTDEAECDLFVKL